MDITITTIPELTGPSGALLASDLLPVWQNSDMRKVTVSELLAATPAPTAGFSIEAASSLTGSHIGKLVSLNTSGQAFIASPSGALPQSKGAWQFSTATGDGLTLPVPAIYRMHFTGQPANKDSIKAFGTYEFVTGPAMSTTDVVIGATVADTVAALLMVSAAFREDGRNAGITVQSVSGDPESIDLILDGNQGDIGTHGNNFVADAQSWLTTTRIQDGVDHAAALVNGYVQVMNVDVQGNNINTPHWSEVLNNGAPAVGTYVQMNGFYFPTNTAALLDLLDRAFTIRLTGNATISYTATTHTISENNFPAHNPDVNFNGGKYRTSVILNGPTAGTGDTNLVITQTSPSTPSRPDMITETVLGKLIALNGTTALVSDVLTQNLVLAANQPAVSIGDQLIITAGGELMVLNATDNTGEFIAPSFMMRNLYLSLQNVSASASAQPILVRMGVNINKIG